MYQVQNDMFCMRLHLAHFSMISQGANFKNSEEKFSSSYINSVRLANQGVLRVRVRVRVGCFVVTRCHKGVLCVRQCCGRR